jgi:hypothetical protein
VPFYRPGSGDVRLACLLASNGIAVAGCLGGAARSKATATVPNLYAWSVPNLHAWPVSNLHAWMNYRYMCMCGCTADTCLYACMINGKCRGLSAYVLALLYLLLLAIAAREGERRGR